LNESINLMILYDDESITVCIKPYCVLSQPDKTENDNMIGLLAKHYNNAFTPKSVHRLDFGVGGVMVYAKTNEAAAYLSEAVRNNNMKKEYIAVVCGIPEESEGIYKDLLFKDSSKNKSYVVDRMRRGVKEASLEYKVLETVQTDRGPMSLVWIKLHTGRTHQIRVQFASRKTPLFGDGKYGSSKNSKKTALWSYKLTFPHPKSKKEVCVQYPPEQSYPWSYFNRYT